MNETIGVKGGHNDSRRTLKIKEKQKKKQGLYRLFAIRWQTAKRFSISQWMAKLPHGNYMCNLGDGLFGYFAVRWLTAKMKWSLPSAS